MIPKGQLILEANYGVLDSSKKKPSENHCPYHLYRNKCSGQWFLLDLGRIEDAPDCFGDFLTLR